MNAFCLRFTFSGGDRSMCDYKYKFLSLRDDGGKLTGTFKLATRSLKYRYNVTGKWWSVVFVDTSVAINDIKQSNFKTAAGVRW